MGEGRGYKNDYGDTRAIAEAVRRPGTRFVGVKTVEQQAVQTLAARGAGGRAQGVVQQSAGSGLQQPSQRNSGMPAMARD